MTRDEAVNKLYALWEETLTPAERAIKILSIVDDIASDEYQRGYSDGYTQGDQVGYAAGRQFGYGEY